MPSAASVTQVDNARTRITKWTFPPGTETGEHVHEYDYCVVPLADGVLKIVEPDGSESMAQMKAGVSYFREKGVHHNVVNANEFEFAFVEVEYK